MDTKVENALVLKTQARSAKNVCMCATGCVKTIKYNIFDLGLALNVNTY